MESAEKERLKEFLKFKGIGQTKFEAAAGLPRGYVNNIRRSITPEKLLTICLYFPDLNQVWLKTGEGEMTKDTHLSLKAQVEELKRDKEHLQKLVGMLEKENAELRAENDELRSQLDKKVGAESSIFGSANNQQEKNKVS